MGFYILAPDIALRSWKGSPRAYIRKWEARPKRLTEEEFEIAKVCDAAHDLPESEALAELIGNNIVIPCRAGETALTAWQRLHVYPCRVMPWLSLEITARCKYNCLHCFNAADNNAVTSQLTFDQITSLLDEAAAAGVQAVLITGGEPMLHKDFRRIVKAVYERDMFVHEINTNGSLLNRDTISFLHSLGRTPEIKISFDGLGFHDWIRGRKGAEEAALSAIRLCVEAGIPVRVQMNLNLKNRSSLRPTLSLLADIGVQRIKIIRTTPTPRWIANVPNGSFTWEEYYQIALEESKWYAGSGLMSELSFWQTITLIPNVRAYRLNRVKYNSFTYRNICPICSTLHGMPAVGANGRIYPCLQYSGTMEARGDSLGNALEKGLTPLLVQGSYCDLAHARVSERLTRGDKCAGCPFLTWCAGGCPALGYLADGSDFLAHDPTACLFFENGWPGRFENALICGQPHSALFRYARILSSLSFVSS